ncbi:MAG TPA: serine--tRNA ligase [Candidatus Saccharimonadales bacterium]|nr:serine--tRNA ligase [Candidatus Saccharimonadales bacterium]
MIDIKQIRENREEVEKLLARKGAKVNLDHLVEIDDQRLKLIKEVDELRAEKNQAASSRDIEKGRAIKEKLEKLEHSLSAVEEEYLRELFKIPNPPLSDVPEGGEEDGVVLRKVGDLPKFDFEVADHVKIGEALGIIDIPRAAKVSGSRFAYLKGDAALLELALVQFATSRLVKEGFTPIFPPALIRSEITSGLGYWQAGGNDNYYLVKDINEEDNGSELNLYLVGTGEHSIVPMHSKEVFAKSELPKKYVAISPCFRRESGSYGKDTHGILRVHQFDKVEMVEFVRPEDDEKYRREMLVLSEELMKELGLPYQVKKLAAGDLGFPSAETIDIETWIPSQKRYRETHSISTTTHFQSKRLNIRYQKEDGSKSYVHILNGTAIAIPRILVAILENYQQKDGSVRVPKVLRDILGKDTLSRTE